MVLHQHEAAQCRTEMACDLLGQRCQDRSAFRRHPALTQVTGGGCRDHQVLHQETFRALENRAWRDFDPHYLFLDFDPGRDLASTAPLRLWDRFRRCGALVHAARLDVRVALQAFQARDLFALFGERLLQCGDLAEVPQAGLQALDGLARIRTVATAHDV